MQSNHLDTVGVKAVGRHPVPMQRQGRGVVRHCQSLQTACIAFSLLLYNLISPVRGGGGGG